MTVDDLAFDRQFFSQFLWERFNKLREEKGLPYRELANKVGLSHNYISTVFSGRTTGNTDFFKKLAPHLWVSQEELERWFAEAKKAEIEHTNGVKLDTPCEEKEPEKKPDGYSLLCEIAETPEIHRQVMEFMEFIRQRDKKK